MPLSNKEIFFESVLAQLPGDIVVFNMEHQYIFVNPQAIKNPEIRKWIIGKTDFEYCEYCNFDLNVAIKRNELFNKVVATKQELELEEVITDRSGKVRYYLRRLTPVFSDFGEISYIIGYGIEITERKKLRIELDTRSSFIDKVINTTQNLIYVKDRDGKFVLANKAMTDLVGLDINSFLDKSNEVVQGFNDETNSYNQIDQQVISTLKPVRIEEPFTKSDGSVLWFDTIKVPLIEQDGIVKVLGISTEITEKWLAAVKERENSERLIAAEQITKSGNWEINYENGEIYWSPGMYVIWERDKKSGLPTIEESYTYMHPDDAVKLKGAIASSKESGLEFKTDLRLILPSGIKYLESITKPIFKSEGKVFKLFGAVRDISEEVNIKNLLKENENRLNEIQELTSMGSFSYDILSAEILWSPPVFKIFKRDPSFGVPAFDEFLNYVHNDDKDSLLKIMEVLSSKVEPYQYNYRIVCDDGELKHLKILNKPILNENNQCIKIVGSIADVTERVQIEKTLLLNEQRLLEAQDLAKSGSWEYNLKSGINIWSAGHYKLWDLDENQPVPSFAEFLSTVHSEYRPKMEEFMKEALSSGKENSIEYRITTNSGASKVMSSRAVVEFDAANLPVRVYGSVLDITERRRNEERLKLSEQRLLEAQEMARFGSWQIDLNSGLMEWSMGTFKIWELDTSKPAPTLKEFYKTIDENDRERIVSIVTMSAKEEIPFDVEYKIHVNGNSSKYVNARGKVGKDENGKSTRLFGTILDITEMKKFEQELIQANLKAEDSLRTKEYFLANVTHELRTPINGVLGMARLLQKTELSTIQRNYIEILSKTADNLLIIINDILDTAKIDSGSLTFEKNVFDAVSVVDTVVKTQLYKAEEKDLFIRHIIDSATIPLVLGDSLRLNQILLNLISNAIKFTEQGEIIITHRVIEETNDKLIIEFAVKDSGIGIEEKEQELIFEKFTQLQKGKAGVKEGTGLGLTITKSLIEKQGGTIWVESTPGLGSTFYFTIPYKKAKDIEALDSIPRFVPGQLGALRVLLAEDNRVNQFITEAMLQDWGFKIDVASNGLEAVEFAKRNDYDIILMDIQMPEMNGVEATHLIRKMNDKKQTPIIALTANTNRQIQKKYISGGMNDCLLKPFKEEALLKKIVTHLKDKEKIDSALRQQKYPARKRPYATNENLYNLSFLRKDARDNPEFMRKMLMLFIETIPPTIAKMVDHFKMGEMDTISSLAHKIKPTLNGVGIVILKEVIRNIEDYRERKRTTVQLEDDIESLQKIITGIVLEFEKEILLLKNNPE